MKGTVKRFYFRKGFGFIEGDQGTEYFFHYTDFTGDKEVLRPGLEVDFEAQQGDKGPCAVAVVQPGGKPAAARPRSTPARLPPAPRNARRGPICRSPPDWCWESSWAPWAISG
ncbi:cold shock domain-containing protein [Immundisolibacter cernigliae]|uniref:cold shock domain-containing protein n=1 Tax=Immundisolibacter cernigliae TaxID=1810504 RepID=UPI00083A8CB5|nr:cold shock domain-containing protein [Immundisolibacter cernigliae]